MGVRRKVQKKVYKVLDMATGQEFRGTRSEVSKIVGIPEDRIDYYAHIGYARGKRWVISDESAGYNKGLTERDRDEWEKAIKEFKERVNKCPWLPERKKEKKYRIRTPHGVR